MTMTTPRTFSVDSTVSAATFLRNKEVRDMLLNRHLPLLKGKDSPSQKFARVLAYFGAAYPGVALSKDQIIRMAFDQTAQPSRDQIRVFDKSKGPISGILFNTYRMIFKALDDKQSFMASNTADDKANALYHKSCKIESQAKKLRDRNDDIWNTLDAGQSFSNPSFAELHEKSQDVIAKLTLLLPPRASGGESLNPSEPADSSDDVGGNQAAE